MYLLSGLYCRHNIYGVHFAFVWEIIPCNLSLCTVHDEYMSRGKRGPFFPQQPVSFMADILL